MQNSSIYSSKESLNSISNTQQQQQQQNNRMKTSVSSTNIEDAFSFAGVYHIFDNHKGAGMFRLIVVIIHLE